MYSAYLNGVKFFDTDSELDSLLLTSASVKLKAGSAGSFTFIVPPCNSQYDNFHRLVDYVDVYDGDNLVFAGRVFSVEMTFDTQYKIECEGLLSILCDSIYRPTTYTGSVRDLILSILASHNEQVEAAKQIHLGRFTIENSDVYRGFENYETSISRLKDLVESFGGFMSVKRRDGQLYLDWVDHFTDPCTQEVELASNLLDIKKAQTSSDIFTVLIPLGADDGDGRLTIRTVNDNRDYIEANAAAIAQYGRIVHTQTWNDVHYASILKTKAQAYMQAALTPKVKISLTAVDLADAGYDVDSFRVGQMITVTSVPHELDHVQFACTEQNLDLLNPAQNKLNLGEVRVGFVESQRSNSSAKIIEQVAAKIERVKGTLEEEIAGATALITGNEGGYVVVHDSDGDTLPDEILIMDTPDINTAVKVWRWNNSGLGYSSTGYDGTYGLAMTINGAIVADYITTGTLSAERVKAGILRGITGSSYWNLETGELYVHGYATTETVDTKLSSYPTTTQMNSAITQKANEITQTVSENYSTKGEVETLSARIANRNYLCATSTPLVFASNVSDRFVIQYGYYTYEQKRLSELGVAAGDYVTISFDWEVTATTYGKFRAEFYRRTVETNALTFVLAANYIEPSASNTSGHFSQKVQLTTDNGRGTVAVIFRYDNAEQGIVTISNLKLEHGEEETPWIAAEEDGSIIGGGENILTGTNTCEAITSSGQWADGTWRKAGSGSGTITFTEIEDFKISPITHGWKITGSAYEPGIGQATAIGQDNAPVEPYKHYTLSCLAKGTGYLNLACGISNYAQARFYLDNVTEWTRYTLVFSGIGATNVIDANHRTNVFFGVTGAGSDITICGMKLEEGFNASKYSASQIEYSTTKEVESKIEQKADSITASVASNYTSKAEYKTGHAENLTRWPYMRAIWSANPWTSNGITWTRNEDGSVTANGTATADSWYNFGTNSTTEDLAFYLQPGTYTLTGCPDGGSSSKWRLRCGEYSGIGSSATQTVDHIEYGNGITFTVSEKRYCRLECAVYNGQTVSNLTFKPMLVRGSIAQDYVPAYDSAAKNQTVTDIEERVSAAELKITDSAIISTVMESETYTQSTNVTNLLPCVYYRENISGDTWTNNGITWTVNSDGSITATGTATGTTSYYLTGTILEHDVPVLTIDPDKRYTLHGCPEGGSASTFAMNARFTSEGTTPSGSSGALVRDTGNGYTITSPRKYVTVYLAIWSGYTCPAGGLTFYPMLEVGTIKHSYVSTHDGTGALVTRMKSAESSITQNANNIALKVSETDYNGNTIASLINQNATTVQISASKINLSGYVTATSLSSSGSTVIDGGRIQGGTISLGGASNGKGQISVYDSNNAVIMTINNTGIYATGSLTVNVQTPATQGFYCNGSLSCEKNIVTTGGNVQASGSGTFGGAVSGTYGTFSNTISTSAGGLAINGGNGYIKGNLTCDGSASAKGLSSTTTLTVKTTSTFTGKTTHNGGIGCTSISASSTINATGAISATKAGMNINSSGTYVSGSNGLYGNCDAYFVGTCSWGSDLRLKKDIKTLNREKSAGFIYSLDPIEYRLIEGDVKKHHGFGAQPLEKILSKIDGFENWGVVVNPDSEDENDYRKYKAIAYTELIADLVATVQSQNERIKALEQRTA